MMDIILKVFHRTNLGQDGMGNLFVMVLNVLQRVRLELLSGLQVQVFPERESPEVVALDDTVEFRVFFLQPHDTRTGEDYLKLRVAVVASAKFSTPVRLLEYLVNQQDLSPCGRTRLRNRQCLCPGSKSCSCLHKGTAGL